MTPNPEDEPVLMVASAGQANFCVDYMDEYHVMMTSFGHSPNLVRQYLRQRFVYSLAEVMAVKIPLPLLNSNEPDAEVLQYELESLGAEVKVTCVPGGPDDGSQRYPVVRVGLAHNV